MSRVIYKQIIPAGQLVYELEIEQGSNLLKVDDQFGVNIALWYECTPEASKIKMNIHQIETGKEIPEDAIKYLGTVKLYRDSYVVHVYEGRKL